VLTRNSQRRADAETAEAQRRRREADRDNLDAQSAAMQAAGAQAGAERDRDSAQRQQQAAEAESDRNRANALRLTRNSNKRPALKGMPNDTAIQPRETGMTRSNSSAPPRPNPIVTAQVLRPLTLICNKLSATAKKFALVCLRNLT